MVVAMCWEEEMCVPMDGWKLHAKQALVPQKGAVLGLGKLCLFLSLLHIHFMFWVAGGDDGGSGEETVEQPVFLQEAIHIYEFSSSTQGLKDSSGFQKQ